MKTGSVMRAAGLAVCAALLLPTATAGFPSAAAKSSPRTAKAALSAPAASMAARVKDPQTTSSVSSVADDKCLRSRKRLWVEGEGWVVRRVATCF